LFAAHSRRGALSRHHQSRKFKALPPFLFVPFGTKSRTKAELAIGLHKANCGRFQFL
jgi:hypothetical protein